MLILLLLDLYLIADLLQHRGQLELQPSEVKELAALVPEEFEYLLDDKAILSVSVLEEHGLLPTVWRSRNAYWGGWLAGIYRQSLSRPMESQH